jgi:hypothetical protein
MLVTGSLAAAVEVDRVVPPSGNMVIAQRVRVDGHLLHVIDEQGQLRATKRSPLSAADCGRLRGARPAGAPPQPDGAEVRVDRVVSIQGAIQVAGQRIQVGRVHARKVVHVGVEDTALTVYDGDAVLLVVPRRSTKDINRFRAKHEIRSGGKMATA